MAPSSAPSTPSGEAGLRTWDAATATGARDSIPGLSTGDVLKNRFVVHQLLTEGTASRLFRARDQRGEGAGDADSWVALKVVTAQPGREPQALKALRREAAIAAQLEHPNLPHILGLDHDGPHTFLCMAWLEGDSLAAILDSRGPRPMTRVQAMHIVEGVGRALVHVHALGITHADVKPGNILVTTEGNATLLDFGVALGPGVGDLPEVHGYTPEYASPEVLAGAAPTPADDLFSLACVAYRMLSGHRAFGTGSARDAAAQETRPPCPPNLSPAQWRALDRALAFTRAERQPDVSTFLAQLKGLRDESAASSVLIAGESSPAIVSAAGSGQLLRPAWPTAALVTSALLGASVATIVLLQREPMPPAGTTRASTANLPKTSPAPPKPVARPAQEPALLAATRPAVLPPERRVARQTATVLPAPPLNLGDPPQPQPDSEPGVSPPVAIAESPPEVALPDTGVTAVERTVPFSSLAMRRYVEPDYPRKAATRQVSGWVDVTFNVDASGRTRDVRVINADPPDVFDDAALSAVRRWRFEAGGGTGPTSSGIRVRFDPGKRFPSR